MISLHNSLSLDKLIYCNFLTGNISTIDNQIKSKIKNISPDSKEYQWWLYSESLILLLTDEQDLSKAKSGFNKLIKQYPQFSPSYFHIGMIYANEELCVQSLEMLNKATEFEPDNIKYILNYSLTSGQCGYREKAIDKLSKINELDLNQSQKELAKKIINKLHSPCLNDSEEIKKLWNSSLETLSSNVSNSEALNNLELKVKEFPRSSCLRDLLGLVYINLDQKFNAKESFKKSIQLDPYNWLAYEQIGILYIQDNNINEGITNLEKAVSLNPFALNSYMELAKIYYQNELFEKAEEKLKNILNIDSFKLAPALWLGRTLIKQKKIKNAEPIFAKILRYFPNTFEANLQLGNIYKEYYINNSEPDREKEYFEKSIEFYNKALQINPQDPYVLQLIKSLEGTKNSD